MESRRAFLSVAAFGLVGASLVPQMAHAASEPARGAAPLWLLAPLRLGDTIGLGWSLQTVAPPQAGAVTLKLRHESGKVARVDLSLREGAPKGPASTPYIDFIVMDGGQGDAPMDESLGRTLRRLAALVGENEAQLPELLSSLDSHQDRLWRYTAIMEAAAKDVQG